MIVSFPPHTRITIEQDQVVTEFGDGTSARCDVEAGDNDWYKGVASSIGYDDFREYARHHEVTHSWLGNRLTGSPSAVLWHVAHGRDAPDWEVEEDRVNMLQWLYKSQLMPPQHEYKLWLIFGDDWRADLDNLYQILREIKP